MESRTNYLEATNTSDLYFKHNHVAWRCFGVSKAIDLQTVIADTAGRHVYSNNDNDAQKRDRADPNYHGKVNRMLYLFLVQASGDAFSEVHFKPLEIRHCGVFWGWEFLSLVPRPIMT